MAQKQSQLDKLLQIMQQLRDPENGCPWDKEQTFESIVPHTIEETYEVADAIFNGDMSEIKDELGDLLFQVVFYAQLGKEQGDFEFDDIAQAINDKLIRRHPHVFSESQAEQNIDLSAQWEQIKSEERKVKGLAADSSILANVTQGLSPLTRANKLQQKCSKVGFDWNELPPVVDKIHEEIAEVLAEVNAPKINQQAVEEEIGDLMFAVVNLARHCKVNPETALIRANSKFEKRFRQVENLIEKQGSSVENSSLEEMEAAWVKIKKL
ncbi:nucleoside triphosphate pyrophosphohydrolase [Paraglaciecola sp. L3A3]|uniref:nucleoside triphosphate pyrophosphohydrolase n=1 Tax=Paraglaciecola sp. L3A3 TaxID=2686358 RepID=UPI00131D22BC|nr:nucleoside triphosphate pyrophosphohydrolase [Paraglaciecola sp. L3A3]